MNSDSRKLTNPDKQIATSSQQQVPRKNRFARAALLVAPFVAAFASGWVISRDMNPEHQPHGRQAIHPVNDVRLPAKNIPREQPELQPANNHPRQQMEVIPPECGSLFAPPESAQYFVDERGRFQDGYKTVDSQGREIICPPTWKRRGVLGEQPELQPTNPVPCQHAKTLPLACDSQYAPPESWQYYHDIFGCLQNGYVVVDGLGRVITCPPTWKRD